MTSYLITTEIRVILISLKRTSSITYTLLRIRYLSFRNSFNCQIFNIQRITLDHFVRFVSNIPIPKYTSLLRTSFGMSQHKLIDGYFSIEWNVTHNNWQWFENENIKWFKNNHLCNSKSLLIKWLLYGNVLLEDPLSYYIIIFKYLPKYVVGTYNTLWVLCSIYLKVLPPM